MKPAIKIENLSKQYQLGTVGTGTLSHDLKRWWHLVRGKEDPYLKIGETNDRSTKGKSDLIWALKDINFEVQQGEILGIIGKNGAGKSTLLKILSKVTGPTTGSITYKGRIGSLLEVGTGFHPELTGRENIYLNGAILGMRKHEITRKFDEIVDFSGCERYIDTPVKRYSSGMTVRLGFAVAAFLEPEILVVDEVLAVGDADFQSKAIGKMHEISNEFGRTVLFVSHNMGSIQTLCNKSIELINGGIGSYGETNKVISDYININYNNDFNWVKKEDKKIPIQITYIEIGCINEKRNVFNMDEEIYIKISYTIKEIVSNSVIAAIISSQNGQILFSTEDTDCNLNNLDNRLIGDYIAEFRLPTNILNQGIYLLRLSSGKPRQKVNFENFEALSFSIISNKNSLIIDHRKAAMLMPFIPWNQKKI